MERMNEVMTQPQIVPQTVEAGVYGSLHAQTGVIGELHIETVEVTLSSEIGRATGAAMLDAESYVDPSVRGALHGQYNSEAAVAAAQTEAAVRRANSSLFEDDKELQDA
jgi:hypothetical protein